MFVQHELLCYLTYQKLHDHLPMMANTRSGIARYACDPSLEAEQRYRSRDLSAITLVHSPVSWLGDVTNGSIDSRPVSHMSCISSVAAQRSSRLVVRAKSWDLSGALCKSSLLTVMSDFAASQSRNNRESGQLDSHLCTLEHGGTTALYAIVQHPSILPQIRK